MYMLHDLQTGPELNVSYQDESERIPYRFSLLPREDDRSRAKEAAPTDIASDLYRSVVRSGLRTTEDTIDLQYTPQAIFRVKPVSRCAASISGHSEAILATQFSPSSSARMVSGSGDSTARIWDCDTSTPLHTLKGHTSWVLAVSYSPCTTLIATGSMDNTVRLWSPSTGQPIGPPLKGHSKWVSGLAWEPYHLTTTHPRLASCSKDTTVRVWNTTLQRIELVLSGHRSSVSCVRWGGTGLIYTASHDKTIKVWHSSDGTLAHTLSAHAHWVNHLALSTDFVLRTSFHDPLNSSPPSTPSDKRALALARFNKAATIAGTLTERLVSASDDFTMYLWWPSPSSSTPTKPLARMLGHQKQVNHVVFSPDGLYIASAAFDNHVKLWNARDGSFIATLRGHVAPVYQCAFSPDSRLLVSGSKDTTLKVWNVRTGKMEEDLIGHADEVYCVDWSPDGDRVASGGRDRAVRLWRH